MSTIEALQPRLDRIRSLALIVGVAGLAGGLVAAFVWRDLGFPSYLVAYMFWVGISLGCVGITMLHHLVGGTWGQLIRRPMEAGGMTLLPMAVLFLPLAFGLPTLYRWARPEEASRDPLILHKAVYLNPNAFLLRAAGYFVLWIVFAALLNRWSAAQDRTSDTAPTRRLQVLSGPGLVLLFLTGSLAAIDWLMSLEPDWYSTIYGPMVIIGQGVSTFAFMIIVAALLSPYEPVSRLARADEFHDLGNLLLAFVMLWAYMSFSQYLIIWSGNLVEEIPWYLRRTTGGWQYVAMALMAFHFFVPFFLLLSRETKRRAEALTWVAAGVVVMHLVDLFWLVIPAPNKPLEPRVPWADVVFVPVATAGIGGIWLATFLWFLGGKSLIPLNTPEIDPAVEHDPGG
jgi:hypothetical protein